MAIERLFSSAGRIFQPESATLCNVKKIGNRDHCATYYKNVFCVYCRNVEGTPNTVKLIIESSEIAS